MEALSADIKIMKRCNFNRDVRNNPDFQYVKFCIHFVYDNTIFLSEESMVMMSIKTEQKHAFLSIFYGRRKKATFNGEKKGDYYYLNCDFYYEPSLIFSVL